MPLLSGLDVVLGRALDVDEGRVACWRLLLGPLWILDKEYALGLDSIREGT